MKVSVGLRHGVTLNEIETLGNENNQRCNGRKDKKEEKAAVQ
jgi:hypothetical protein